jgi:hypothetical protein
MAMEIRDDRDRGAGTDQQRLLAPFLGQRALQAQRREAIGIAVLACSARRRPLSGRVSMQQKISGGRAARMR